MKAIIFDMDGLMVDSQKLYWEVERELAREYGKEVPDEVLHEMMGRKPLESLGIFAEALDLDVSLEELAQKRDRAMEQKYRTELTTMKGLEECIACFHGTLQLAIATGSPKLFLDIVIDQLNIRDRFAVLQTSDEITHGKPHPEIYQNTVKKLQCESHECIVLEDSRNGALSGERAGCYVIAIPSEYNRHQDFSFADYIAADLLDAKDHIQTLRNEN